MHDGQHAAMVLELQVRIHVFSCAAWDQSRRMKRLGRSMSGHPQRSGSNDHPLHPSLLCARLEFATKLSPKSNTQGFRLCLVSRSGRARVCKLKFAELMMCRGVAIAVRLQGAGLKCRAFSAKGWVSLDPRAGRDRKPIQNISKNSKLQVTVVGVLGHAAAIGH